MDRRRFLETTAFAAVLPALDPLLGRTAAAQPAAASPFARFRPIAPSQEDDVVLPEGFRYDVVIKWGDPFTRDGRPFGYNNDWIGAFPLPDPEEALLAVNHEYVSLAEGGDVDLYPETFRMLRGRDAGVDDFKRDVGLSVLRVRRDGSNGSWRPVASDPLNRRIDALTPCSVDGPAARLLGDRVHGTFANCAGQTTPWGTALTCEENFQDQVPEFSDVQGRFLSGGRFDAPGGHYGWIVEIDPFDPGSTPVKHTWLGRFRHENVGLRVEPGRPVAGYLGDDRIGGHLWKFVSSDLYQKGDGRRNRRLLSSGRLFAARFHADGSGEWRPLELSTPLDPHSLAEPMPPLPRGAKQLRDCYASLGAALLDAYQAANAIGATPSGRPEDIEVHPADGSVYVSFTSAANRPGPWPNPYGEVWRIEEENGDVQALRFRWSRFAVGGPAAPEGGSAFAHPDNLVFDAQGDLWMASDISGSVMNLYESYRVFKNNGLFRIATAGDQRGRPLQFASFPCEAEAAGPVFAPGGQALFVSVQHPGERFGIRRDPARAPSGSNWPHRKLGAPPQPAVVVIRPA